MNNIVLEEMSSNELEQTNGGSNLGNALILTGSVLLAVSTGGTAGLVFGGITGIMGLLSDWND